jgi:hypothetical protein
LGTKASETRRRGVRRAGHRAALCFVGCAPFCAPSCPSCRPSLCASCRRRLPRAAPLRCRLAEAPARRPRRCVPHRRVSALHHCHVITTCKAREARAPHECRRPRIQPRLRAASSSRPWCAARRSALAWRPRVREAAGLALAARPRALELEARVAVGLNEARVHNEEAVDALGRAGVAPTVTLAVAAVAHQRAGERSKVQVRPATTLLRATALAEGTRPVHGRAPRPCGRPVVAICRDGQEVAEPG